MSIVRWNLKEGGGKSPARGSRTSIEASNSWASLHNKTKPMLPKAVESKWSGYVERKTTFLPGEVCRYASKAGNHRRKAVLNGRSQQRS